MRAFVIKNKEGKYFGYFDSVTGKSEFSNKPQKFVMFNTIRNAKHIKNHFDLKNCEVAEITIAEGDLQKENEVLRRALELAIKYANNFIDSDFADVPNSEYFIQQAKEQRDED